MLHGFTHRDITMYQLVLTNSVAGNLPQARMSHDVVNSEIAFGVALEGGIMKGTPVFTCYFMPKYCAPHEL